MQQNNISLSCPACGDAESELGGRLKLLRTLCISVLLTMPLFWNLRTAIQLAIATVIQFWLGQYFYKGAWTALKQKVLGMDLLVAGDEFDMMYALEKATGVPMPANLRSLRERPVLHTGCVKPGKMRGYVLDLLEGKA